MARLFVAVRPTPEVVALLAALERPAVPGVRWSTPEQWLVKLRPLGHVADRAGSRERSDKADLWRSVRLQLAIVVFAAIIMLFVLFGTIINQRGGNVDTPFFPWEWGKDQPKDQPANP